MITDSRVWEEQTVPEDLHSRDGELNALANALGPARDSATGEPMAACLFGPGGSGKTVCARFAARKLRRTGVRTHYINCWRAYRRPDFLEAIFDGLGNRRAEYHRSLPVSDALARFRRALDGPFVVIIDEADVLNDASVLQQIAAVPEVVPIVIANREEELFERFEGTRDALTSGVHIHFDKYELDALTDILRSRAEHGLEPGVWDEDLLFYTADSAAGNARLAIQTLGVAGERGTGRELVESDIDEALPIARAKIKRRAYSSLDADMRVLIKIVAEADGGEIAPSELYDEFSSRVEDPPSNRTVRTWLADLSHYNLIERRGATRGRRYALDDELRKSLFGRPLPN